MGLLHDLIYDWNKHKPCNIFDNRSHMKFAREGNKCDNHFPLLRLQRWIFKFGHLLSQTTE